MRELRRVRRGRRYNARIVYRAPRARPITSTARVTVR
jgi:hypothetical protein